MFRDNLLLRLPGMPELQTAMATHDADSVALHAPQSIVFHQAALATDGGNWLAANELGVLYARLLHDGPRGEELLLEAQDAWLPTDQAWKARTLRLIDILMDGLRR